MLVLFTDVGGTDEGFVIRLNDEAGTDIGTATQPGGRRDLGDVQPRGRRAARVFDGSTRRASGGSRSWTTPAGADVGTLFGWTLLVTH